MRSLFFVMFSLFLFCLCASIKLTKNTGEDYNKINLRFYVGRKIVPGNPHRTGNSGFGPVNKHKG